MWKNNTYLPIILLHDWDDWVTNIKNKILKILNPIIFVSNLMFKLIVMFVL